MTTNKKNDCGRPGVNGGFIANPNIQFGVNCFGIKPPAKQNDIAMMESKNNQNIPKSKEDIILDAKVKFWKENSEKMLKKLKVYWPKAMFHLMTRKKLSILFIKKRRSK